MTFYAAGPYPYPSEMAVIFLFFSSEKAFKLANGSEPGDKINIKGVTVVESA